MLNKLEFKLCTVSNVVVSWNPLCCLLGLNMYRCPDPKVPPLTSEVPSNP